jgi:hypothetical protein
VGSFGWCLNIRQQKAEQMPGFGGLEILSRKLSERHVWERMLRERLAEPLHLNLLAIPVALFGSLRAKIYLCAPSTTHILTMIRIDDQSMEDIRRTDWLAVSHPRRGGDECSQNSFSSTGPLSKEQMQT